MEEEINRQLNVFSVNMRVAYGGPNTIEAQIDYKSDAGTSGEYTWETCFKNWRFSWWCIRSIFLYVPLKIVFEFSVYSEVGGDEELPLGPEFQEHLRCFIDTSKKDPVQRYRMCEKLIRQLQ